MPLIKGKARRAMGSFSHGRFSSANNIKVVKIKKPTAEFAIRIKLKTVNCRSAKYTALSYAHDPDSDAQQRSNAVGASANASPQRKTQRTILCDGAPLRVSQTLWDVLDQLRRLNSDVLIWIDQLCINFEIREERAAQVNMMSHVYANASHVIVWLGKNTAATNDTILCMKKLTNAIDWRKIPRDFMADFRDPVTYARFGMDRISVQQWNNIYQFCHAKWFSRLWPFFELASAKQAMFLIGDAFMDYDFLMDFAMVLGLTGWLEALSEMATDGYDEDFVGLTKMLGPVATLRSNPIWHPQHPDYAMWMKSEYNLSTEEERAWMFFELLLQQSERFECSDERDRIFAPLAFVKKVFAGTAVNKSWPIVDYGISTETISSHFAGRIQKHIHRPSILATAEVKQARPSTQLPAMDHVQRGRAPRRIPLD